MATVDGISEAELKRFLDLLEAVRAKQAVERSYDVGREAPDIERQDSTFGYEVLSGLMGRSGSKLRPFARTLAKVTRRSGTLEIALLNPEDKERPLRPPAGSTVEVRVKDVKDPVTAEVDDKGLVALPQIKDTQEIAGLIIRDAERRPIAVAGRIAALRTQSRRR